ncbi:MAG: S8 family serine peptidase [Haloarculaceae archaeon]
MSDRATEQGVRFEGATRPGKLSGGLQFQLRDATATERVPVLVVFDRQPNEALALNRLEAAEARQRMQALAEDTQANVLDYLDRQAERGRAADVRSFWIRNVVAVEATPAVIEELTASTQVDRVVYDSPVRRADGGYTGDAGAFLDGLGEYGNLSVSPDGLERDTSGLSEWGIEYVGADDVQEAGVTGTGVNVSVVDSGVDEDHPAIPRVTRWKDFVNASNTEPVDPDGHGTHVAGTIAGRSDAKRSVGVAPGANLFGARALDADGGGRSSDVIDAFQWSANNSADVVSASLGRSPILDSRTGELAVRNGSSANATFEVFATGNATTTGDDGPAFRPAFVLVRVEPTSYDGSALTTGSTTQASVEGNLSLVLRGPDGNRSLTGYSAGYMYQSGEVPGGLKLLKYEPSTVREIRNGTWSLTVENANPANVSVNVTTAPVYPSNGSDEVSSAANNLAAQGIVPVISAGNAGGFLGNQSVGSPGSAADAITVGATGYETDDVARYSSRGPVGFGADARPGVDIVAPGTDIVSAASTDAYPGEPDYVALSGTSMAAPHVSGTAALLLAANPGMSASQVGSTLKDSARPVPGGENAVGAGVLDAWAAVNGTTDLGTPGTEPGVRDLWAGIGNTGETYVDLDVSPPTDAVGDAGTAPDIEAAYVDARYDPDFQVGFADSASPNASVTVYVDVDGNGTTGAQFTDPAGAEYRFDATRTYFPGNDTYALELDQYDDTYRYNDSSAAFEPADLYVYDRRADADFVGFQVSDNDLTGVDDGRFDWYVVSRNASTGGTDRIPDAGALDTVTTSNVSGIAVAWNATAGGPAADVPVNFSVYDQESGALVGNDTVRTNASGLATTSFEVTTSGGFGDFTVEVADDRNNRISQTYTVDVRELEYDYYSGIGGLPYEVEGSSYLSEPDATVSLNVPIYRIDNGSYETYEGPASVRLQNYAAPNRTEEISDVENLTVTDGVLRTTVDFSTRSVDDYGGQDADVNVRVALESVFNSSTDSEYAGEVELVTERYETNLGPDSTVVGPGERANLTFQNVLASTQYESRQQRPANVTASYNVTWVKDRYVASVYRDLPDSVAMSVRQARSGEARLGEEAYRELREALGNVSADGTTVEYVTGQAAPTRRGVGAFDVTPPADARFGVVEASVDPDAAGDVPVSTGRATVFVDGRFGPYVREPTSPSEEDRYDLDVDAYWPRHTENGYVVPNETIEVDVRLYDYRNDTYVGGTNVSLYTTGGATRTVTTSGSGEVTTEIAAPDIDYRNVTGFDLTEQQIVAVAGDTRQSDGSAVADEEFVYADSYRVGSSTEEVRPDPDLRWSDGTLNLTLRYRNSSWDRVNGTETLLRVASPDGFDVRDELFVGFVNANGSSVYNESFDAPLPADVPREWEVGAQTPSVGPDTFWIDEEGAGGPAVALVSPDALRPNVTQNVTLEVTDRNGRPIEGAVVRFGWVDAEQVGSPGASTFGTTGADGRMTVPVTPETADGDVTYEVGLATANYSTAVYERRGIAVRSEPASVTGQFTLANGSAAVDDAVVAFPRSGDPVVDRTDASGNYALSLERGATYRLGYYQGNGTDGWTAEDFARDGNVDMYGFANVTADGDVSLGSRQLPGGHVLDVVVENESGRPVRNASVTLYHWNGTHGDASDGRAGWVEPTRDDGRIYPNGADAGMELTGEVTIAVEPPANSTAFVDETYRRNLTVDANATETIRLDELGSGDLVVSPDDVDANVTTARFALENVTYDSATPGEYRWTFGDGENVTTATNTTSHVYTRAGEYEVTVEAVDANGTVLVGATTTVTVTQAGDANLTATPSTADVNVDDVTFDLANLTVDSNVTVANYTWAFGDGERLTTGGATTTANHTYDTLAGEVTARVTAYNASERTLFAETVNVTVTDRVAPTVVVDAPDSVPQNADLVVDASNSSDNDRIANYTFETDTGYANTSTSPTRTLNFSDPGNHTVTVTATDAAGNANSTTLTVAVRARPDLAVDVSTAATQRLQDGVNATVNVTNVGGNGVEGTFEVAVDATAANSSTRRTYNVSGLASGAGNVSVVDLTGWARANRVTGDVTVDASVEPVTNEADTDDNADAATTTVTYSDLRVRLAVPTQAPEGENVTAYLLFTNAGTAASDATNATLTVNGTTETVPVPSLAPGEVNRTSRTDRVRANRTYDLAVTDPVFPAGNATSRTLRVFQYDLTPQRLSVPAEVEQGDTVLVVGEFDVNAPGEVNASLATGGDLAVQGSATKGVYAQQGTNTVRWRVAVPENATQQEVALDATLSRLDQTGRLSANTSVVVPKLRLKNETSVRVATAGGSANATLADLANVRTYDQTLTVDVQAGARGRALKGLEYLFNYPRGCVEQTASPMLAALNTDQYYRSYSNVSYDRQRINESISQGVDRLAPNGASEANAQHANGAWSMWGNDPDGDLFYTVYALYGTTAVENDAVQGPANAGQLGELNYSASVDWLAGKQRADGSFRSNHYYEDRRSMTGLALVAADRANDAGVSGTNSNLTRLRQDATAYLLDTQNPGGSWNDEDGDASPMATALAVRGLATVADSPALNGSQQQAVDDALNASAGWLEAEQNQDGSWDGYHQSRWWNSQGDVSESTGQVLLALDSADATDVAVDNATLDAGVAYLTDVYREDGSFGYTRATAVAIDALQRLSTSGGERTVTVELVDTSTGSVLLDETVTVSGDDPIRSVRLTDDANASELRALREAGELEVQATSSDPGVVIVGVSSDQVVDEREYLTEES